MGTESTNNRVAELLIKIKETEEELKRLKEELARASEGEYDQKKIEVSSPGDNGSWKWPLRLDEYERYGRQLIIPDFGIEGQLRLKDAAVLLVGAGGLGCPAAAYLAGAGAGTIGLVDGDEVEASNLHRQITHTTSRVGEKKVDSVISYLKDLNPNLTYKTHHTHLLPQNAEQIISQYDLVLDCTDHPTSRYLVSDTCVLLSKPLVSASAFKTDGQLIVLNAPALPRGDPSGGPCYRCIFPKPPPPSSVVSCGEGGVLGPVVGAMGVLQALEAIRLITSGVLAHSGKPSALSEQETVNLQPALLIFSHTPAGPTFRRLKMRGRRNDCFACSEGSSLTLSSLKQGGVDYVSFCGINEPVSLLDASERISAADFASRHPSPAPDHVLLDVREKEHFGIAAIPGAVNVPISKLMREAAPSPSPAPTPPPCSPTSQPQKLDREPGLDSVTEPSWPDWLPENLPLHAPIYVICKQGNDSQLATRRLKEMGLDGGGRRFVGDIKGGMVAWKAEVDETLPFT